MALPPPRPLRLPRLRRTARLLVVAGAFLVTAGCAHGGGSGGEPDDGPPIETEVEVTGLKKEERDVLEKNVCALPRVEGCKLTVDGNRALLGFTYRGTLSGLRDALAHLPHPGLEVQKATARLVYQGFDNIPPELKVVKPDAGSAHTVSEIEVLVEVVATDIKEVLIQGEPARRVDQASASAGPWPIELIERRALVDEQERTPGETAVLLAKKGKKAKKSKPAKPAKKGKKRGAEKSPSAPAEVSARGEYLARVKLEDGKHDIVVRARDEAGNEAAATIPVIVDTTPPVLAVTVQIKGLDRATLTGQVEGAAKVLVDGNPVSIGMFGQFTKDMPADPDKRVAEVVAVDEYGNESTLKVELVAGFAASTAPEGEGKAAGGAK